MWQISLDLTAVVNNLITNLPAILVAIGGLVLVLRKVEQVHVATNSKMDAFLAATAKANYKEGRADQKAMGDVHE